MTQIQTTPPVMRRVPRRFAGLTLIELLVALGIGSFLMLGAVTVFVQGRTTFRINESVARIQENARFVLNAVEPDIRMAHYFGLTTRSSRIQGRDLQTNAHTMGPAACGSNWAIDLDNSIEGSNNAYPWACAANGGAVAGSDTLTIRRVGEDALAPGALVADEMYVQSARLQPGQIFVGNAVPAGYDPATSATFELIANGYYVSQTSSLSTAANNVPALRVKTLVDQNTIADQEVLPGVEDMQIQFGVDTDPAGGAERGVVNRYVNPDAGILDPTDAAFLPDAEILAVRIWLRMRAERPENGYSDTTNYVYADQDFTANDSFRRALVSKTIYLRNTRPAS